MSETYKGTCKICGAENEVEVSDDLQGMWREFAISGIQQGVMCDACDEAESNRREAA